MPIVTACAIVTAGGVLFWRRDVPRGTTLVPAWWWVWVMLAGFGAREILLAFVVPPEDLPAWAPAIRLIVATGTFCPVMAVLGARRPQHQAWQFVVVTMWIMLALPAWEAIFLGRLESMDIGPVRGWFLWLIIAVNLLTYVPTRFFLSALLSTAGQVFLLMPFLPGLTALAREPGSMQWSAGVLLISAAIIAAGGFARFPDADATFDSRWRKFRDLFGTMWALRVLERINAAAQMYHWPMSLTWTGFYFHNTEDNWETLPPKEEEELRQAMENLMRRFM